MSITQSLILLAVAMLVLICLPLFVHVGLRLALAFFPGLHPCRRGIHVADFRQRVRVTRWGRGMRNIGGFVEQANYCPRCDLIYGDWEQVDGPNQVAETDLTPAELAQLDAGNEVFLSPASGKLWE